MNTANLSAAREILLSPRPLTALVRARVDGLDIDTVCQIRTVLALSETLWDLYRLFLPGAVSVGRAPAARGAARCFPHWVRFSEAMEAEQTSPTLWLRAQVEIAKKRIYPNALLGPVARDRYQKFINSHASRFRRVEDALAKLEAVAERYSPECYVREAIRYGDSVLGLQLAELPPSWPLSRILWINRGVLPAEWLAQQPVLYSWWDKGLLTDAEQERFNSASVLLRKCRQSPGLRPKIMVGE